MGDRKYFGTDGIRGKANTYPMTAEVALRVGLAAGRLFMSGDDRRHLVVIGKDTRLSGYMLEPALVAGFASVGMDVRTFGPLPTPGVAMMTRSMRADLGVMISASHNDYADNGIKLFGPDGYKLSDEIELKIEAMMDASLDAGLAPSNRLGRVKRHDEVPARYIEIAKSAFPKRLSLKGLRVAIDCANGAGYKVAPTTLYELGAEVFPSGSSRTGPISTPTAARPIRPPWPRPSNATAPTSASRSTATQTGSSSATRRAPSSTATRSWRSWASTSRGAAV
jgi:phosphoglucosamine mutase